jgi:hypothetical protein
MNHLENYELPLLLTLEKPGSNYVAIPHDPLAVNEFKNPDLLPLI